MPRLPAVTARSDLSPEQRAAADTVLKVFVEQAAFDALGRKYSGPWLVELTAIVNFFAFVSGICNGFEVEPPTGGDKLRHEA